MRGLSFKNYMEIILPVDFDEFEIKPKRHQHRSLLEMSFVKQLTKEKAVFNT